MNICFFLGGFHQNGGIGRVTSMLINKLVETENINITALCYFNTKSPNIYQISDKITQEYFLLNYQSMTKLLLTGGIRKLRKYLCDNNIDIVIACGALFFPICTLACKKIKTKCICWEHSNPEGNSDHKNQYYARRFGITLSDLNVVLTNSALNIYKEKYHAHKTIQIYNPIDPEVFTHSTEYNPECNRIISVGRLTYQKNFQCAVDVAKIVLKKHPDWEWDIFGKGEEESSLKSSIISAGLEQQMHLCGQVTDMYDRYGRYSFIVMTSRYEGFPMTLLEGSGNALPLVSFDIPTGPNEIINDGENGFLVKPFDVAEMANKIDLLISNSDLRSKMSAKSREMCKRFTEKEIVEQWITILKTLN